MLADPAPCPGCGACFPPKDGPAHAYIGASPGCWAAYGEFLAREYEDPRYFAVHDLTVDTYAAQHPGQPSRRSIQSVAVHLIALYLLIERGSGPAEIAEARKAAVKRGGFIWLEPPPAPWGMTVLDVAPARGPAEHARLVRQWAGAVWRGWASHHAAVRAWAG